MIDGQPRSGSRQQWLSRNTEWGGWTGSDWNMVFVGDTNPPAGNFPNPPYTVAGQAPTTREKPFRGGRRHFFQNELPYDPPNQTAW
ncbi:hypothetical protein GCM10009753_47170 [Streptantibioticus ferralitis]